MKENVKNGKVRSFEKGFGHLPYNPPTVKVSHVFFPFLKEMWGEKRTPFHVQTS